jgi:hypothetical protein
MKVRAITKAKAAADSQAAAAKKAAMTLCPRRSRSGACHTRDTLLLPQTDLSPGARCWDFTFGASVDRVPIWCAGRGWRSKRGNKNRAGAWEGAVIQNPSQLSYPPGCDSSKNEKALGTTVEDTRQHAISFQRPHCLFGDRPLDL